MTLFQFSILALVFIFVVAGLLGLTAMLQPSAARRRLTGLTVEAGQTLPFSERLLGWVATATRPVSKLSMPEEGFENPVRQKNLWASFGSGSLPST